VAVSLQEVEHIAHLARIRLTAKEKELFARQLTRVLEYMEKLNELDTAQVQPLSHPLDIKNVFRMDEVSPSLTPEEALENAPLKDKHFFRVPQVVKK